MLISDAEHRSLLYLDPPYFDKGNDLYQHGFERKDHERLAEALQNTNHTWVLSYDDCPEVRELYEDWASVEPLNVNYSITATKDSETGEQNVSNENRSADLSKKHKGSRKRESFDVSDKTEGSQ